MKFGSVCSGIEAASVAWHPLGWRAAWLAEIEPFPSAVLAHHYPDVPNYGDMTALPEMIVMGDIEAPDILCGGTPCQAFSVAGLRKSLDDARGNLSLVFCEIANAIDIARTHDSLEPCVVFWENVPGVLNTKDNAFGCFLAGLAGEDDALVAPGGKWANAGCVFGPQRTVAWRVLDAQYFGVAQRRRRVFVVASAREGFDPAAVLFEFDGLRRDTAPSRQAGQRPTRTLSARTEGGGGLVTDFELGGGLVPEIMPTMDQRAGRSGANSFATSGGLIPVGTLCVATGQAGAEIGADMAPTLNRNHEAPYAVYQTTHTLRGEGFDASEDGTGRGTPVVAGALCKDTYTGGMGGRPESAAAGHVLPVAFPANLSGTQCASSEDIAPSMGAKNPMAVAFAQNSRDEVRLMNGDGSIVGALAAEPGMKQTCYINTAMQVRRLTPRECERLQGFPDDYTLVPNRGKPAADGPRYKALGNSWAVPNVRWIGWRIAAQVFGDLA